jgi:ferredoxin-NADP reductase
VTEPPLTLPATPHAPTGGWRQAVVREVRHPSARAVLLRLDVMHRMTHMAGQHYVVRLTADDGYTAQRSYSVSSAPSDPLVELFVERLPNGEVSTFLADVVRPGDELQVRGPIGGWFVWDGISPALGVGGGTGVVPLVAMARLAREIGGTERLRLAVSGRNLSELPYADELTAAGATVALTRTPHGDRPPGRLSATDLTPLLVPGATAYVCGSAGFAEFASLLLVGLGVPVQAVRIERFGPSG